MVDRVIAALVALCGLFLEVVAYVFAPPSFMASPSICKAPFGSLAPFWSLKAWCC